MTLFSPAVHMIIGTEQETQNLFLKERIYRF